MIMKKLLLFALVALGGVMNASADNYLKGNWDEYAAHQFTFSDGVGTVTIANLAANTNYWFGIQDGDNFYSIDEGVETINRNHCTKIKLYTGNGHTKMTTTIAGSYIFKIWWDSGNPCVWVIYPDQTVVHCYNYESWSDFAVYRYDSNLEKNDGAFPGTQIASNVNANNANYYDITLNDNFYDKIIFNCNEKNTNGKQTDNLTLDFNSLEYWITGKGSITNVAPENWVGYTRDVTVGNFGTICLPFAATVTGATVFKIVSKVESNNVVTGVNLESVDALEAGKAYIFKATGTTLNATYSGSYTEATADYGMMGNLSSTAVTVPAGSYVVKNNELRPVGSNVTVGQYKGYITLDGIGAVSSARGDYFMGFDDEATGIESVQAENSENVMFNLQGQRVNNAQKGLVIVGGKKMLRK